MKTSTKTIKGAENFCYLKKSGLRKERRQLEIDNMHCTGAAVKKINNFRKKQLVLQTRKLQNTAYISNKQLCILSICKVKTREQICIIC